MVYKSNRFTYLTTKYGPLVGAIVPFGVSFLVTLDFDQEPGSRFASIVSLIFSVLLYLMFRYISKVLVEVELSYLSIQVPSRGATIDWMNVREIKFTVWGLYKLRTDEFTIYFAPFDISMHAFGYKFTSDEFDEIIEKRKRELKI